MLRHIRADNSGIGMNADRIVHLCLFIDRQMNIGTMDHRIGITEIFAESRTDRDLPDDRSVKRIQHDEIIGIDRASSRPRTATERIHRRKSIGAKLDPGTDLP